MGSLQNPLIQLTASAMMFIPLLSACGGGGGDSGSEPSTLSTSTQSSISVSGKLAQAYVGGATIIADKKESGSQTGNCKLDAGEIETTSSTSGDFSLSVSYGNYVICTTGGSYKNSDGKSVAAAPMMTPAPETNSSGWNVTPLTTLVATQPSLKTKLDELGGWNADIASSSGVPGKLLRVAKTVETYWQVSTRLTSDSKKQLDALNKLALGFQEEGVPTNDTSLKNLAASALDKSMNDPSINTDLTDVSSEAMKDILKASIIKITDIIPDSNTKIVEKDVQDKFDDAKEELDSNAEETISKKPKLKEIAPIGTTENSKPYYTFSSTYGGTISYSGNCKSSTTSASKGENTIQFNSLSAGTYSDCSLTVTSSEGEVSDALNISSFTIKTKVTDTTPPTLALITAVEDFPTTNSPSFVFFSTEAGKINVLGKCQSNHQNAITGENSMFTFSNLEVGKYNNCKITVMDAYGNESTPLNVPTFEIKKLAELDSAIGFNPVISKIKCTIYSAQELQISATVKDDGNLGDLCYEWTSEDIKAELEIESFCEIKHKDKVDHKDLYVKRCINDFDNGLYLITGSDNCSSWSIKIGINPEKGNANQINTTIQLKVTDKGGGTTKMERNIQPNSC